MSKFNQLAAQQFIHLQQLRPEPSFAQSRIIKKRAASPEAKPSLVQFGLGGLLFAHGNHFLIDNIVNGLITIKVGDTRFKFLA